MSKIAEPIQSAEERRIAQAASGERSKALWMKEHTAQCAHAQLGSRLLLLEEPKGRE